VASIGVTTSAPQSGAVVVARGRLAPAVTAVACLVAVAALVWWGALALHHHALHRHAGEQARKEATRAGWRNYRRPVGGVERVYEDGTVLVRFGGMA
jgi:hypothetical protein